MTTADPNMMMAVLFARDHQEAEEYCKVLEEVSIPALVGTGNLVLKHGIPVLVPDSFREHADEVIASYEATINAGWDDEDDDDASFDDDDEDDDEDDLFSDDEDEDEFDEDEEDDEDDDDDLDDLKG